MPFWKRSEDPWDQKPEKRQESRESDNPQANPFDSLKAWNDQRKTRAREKEEAKHLPPEPCPFCGKEMEQGFITGGRDGVHWYPGIYKFDPFRGLSGERMDVLDDSAGFACFKITWLCRECRKVIFDMPDPPEVYDSFVPQTEGEETKEEEKSGE